MATIIAVSPTELIKSGTFGTPVITELNTRCIKVTGTTEAGGPITGALVINANPTMKLRTASNLPTLQFEDNTGATRYGYIQGQAAQIIYGADAAAAAHRFLVNGAEMMKVDATGIVTTAGIDVNAGGVRIGGNGGQLSLIDTSTAGSDFNDVYMQFYGNGVSMVSPGVRSGYIGFASSTTLVAVNEIVNGGISLIANGTGTISLTSGSGGRINAAATDVDITSGASHTTFNTAGVHLFESNGVETGRMSGSSLLWGKTAADGGGTDGVEVATTGRIGATVSSASVPNLFLRHVGAAHADGVAYVQFVNSTGGILSEINQDDVSPVGIKITNCAVTAPSDYRLKDDLGPMLDAVGRVRQLQPKHLAWKDTGREFDGFIAHELAAVVPDAVTGDKDAIYDADEAARMGAEPGDIKAQQLDQLPLIPLLTAALQELVDRVEALEDAS